MCKVVRLEEKLNSFSDTWNPRIVGELNGQHVKLAKLKGEFVWHKHDEEDELFYVLSGTLKMHFRDRTEIIEAGEFIIVPRGIEHKPEAQEICEVMLFEPVGTVNTGDQHNDFTRTDLEEI